VDDSFYRAFLPAEHRVCGLKLKPYSSWHALILYAIKSSLVEGQGNTTPSDLVIACRVCQTTWPKQPSLKMRLRDWFRVKWMERYPSAFLREFESFALYLKDHTSRPQFWNVVEGGSFREVTGPVVMWTLAGLITSSTLQPKQAWNMSVGEAAWYDASIAERNGSHLRFLWDSDVENPPVQDNLSEDELYEQAVEHLGSEAADRWYKARKENDLCH